MTIDKDRIKEGAMVVASTLDKHKDALRFLHILTLSAYVGMLYYSLKKERELRKQTEEALSKHKQVSAAVEGCLASLLLSCCREDNEVEDNKEGSM